MEFNLKRDIFIKGIKIAFGSAVSIFISRMINLDYATSAGIITLLTIQDTKTETLKLSLYRFLSFAMSMIAAFIINSFPIYNTVKYSLFLLVVVEISFLLRWDGSISTNAVFGTHIFISDSIIEMNYDILLNEFGLLTIGTIMAIIMNTKMPNLEKEIKKDMDYVEHEIKRIFTDIINHLSEESDLNKSRYEIMNLINHLDSSIDNAAKNMNNITNEKTKYYLGYFIMRKNQCVILLHLIRSFLSIEKLPDIMMPAVEFLNSMAENFSIKNSADKKLLDLHTLMIGFKNYPLPATREEFEVRATIYHILNEIGEFINLKKDFHKRFNIK